MKRLVVVNYRDRDAAMMESGQKRSFDRLVDKASARDIIDQSMRQSLSELWQRYRWRKGFTGFYQVLAALSAIFILVSCVQGFHALAESKALHSVFSYLGVAATHVYGAAAYVVLSIVGILDSFFGLFGTLFEGLYIIVSDLLTFVADVAVFILSLAWLVIETLVSALAVVFRFLYSIVAGVLTWLYGLLGMVLGFVFEEAIAPVGRFVLELLGTVFGWIFWALSWLMHLLYDVASSFSVHCIGSYHMLRVCFMMQQAPL